MWTHELQITVKKVADFILQDFYYSNLFNGKHLLAILGDTMSALAW